jgi:hypothetical protein
MRTHWVTHSKNHCNNSKHKVFSVFTSLCSVAASNSGRSPSSGFPNFTMPQLLDSYSNRSQGLNRRSTLTPQLGRSTDIASERTQQKIPFIFWCGWRGIKRSIAATLYAWRRTAWQQRFPQLSYFVWRHRGVRCSSVACTIIFTMISCLLSRKIVTALYMLQYFLSLSSFTQTVDHSWTEWPTEETENSRNKPATKHSYTISFKWISNKLHKRLANLLKLF